MNFSLVNKDSKKTIFAATGAIFLFATIFGIFFCISEMQMNGSGCLLNDNIEMCAMNTIEHLNFWKSTFTILLTQNNNFIAVLTLLAIFFVLNIIFYKKLSFQRLEVLFLNWKIYTKNTFVQLFNYLQEAFSQGILNPKIYVFATI